MNHTEQRTIFMPTGTAGGFDYAVPVGLPTGTLVEVSLAGRAQVGMLGTGAQPGVPPEKLKPITRVLDVPPLAQPMQQWLQFVAEYTVSPLGMVLALTAMKHALSLPKKPFIPVAYAPNLPMLSDAQTVAAEAIQAAKNPVLLDGVTGSGKTEIYFHAIAQALEKPGAQVLVMLPEIALTHQWLSRFEATFGALPAVWHSKQTPAQRARTWHAVVHGDARVIVGARSALFLPYAKLALIVVDEEHDHAYKQEDGVRYQARDMAVARAKYEGVRMVLASATPSLETTQNVARGRYESVQVPSRFGNAQLPSIRAIDMRQEVLDATHFISTTARRAIAETLMRDEQALCFLNRRGYAPLVLCRACGHRFQCPHCAAWLVSHQAKKRLQCHHCGYHASPPVECPECKAGPEKLVACGPGVERIAEELRGLFPGVTCSILSSDDAPDEDDFARVIAGEVPLLVGTQMVAKGHHFPNLTLVVVIDADVGLNGGDLRAAERTYQLLHQLSGRAGRAEKPGQVLVQTYAPEHPVMQALCAGARDDFLAEEAAQRGMGGWPPYGQLAAIVVDGPKEVDVLHAARSLAQRAPMDARIRVLGPAPAPLSRLKGQFRYRLLVKAEHGVQLQKTLQDWLHDVRFKGVRILTDVNPYYFM